MIILVYIVIVVEFKDFLRILGYVINVLFEKIGKIIEDIDLFEINEVFVVVVIVSIEIVGIDLEKLNVNGGVVVMGYLIGVSGVCIIVILIYVFK